MIDLTVGVFEAENGAGRHIEEFLPVPLVNRHQ